MVQKTISNPANAFNTGGSWQEFNDIGASQTVIHLWNNTGVYLYTGDIVSVDTTTANIGTSVVLPNGASDVLAFGCVGGEISNSVPGAGGFYPQQDAPTRTDTVTTQTSTTTLDTSVKASDVGATVTGAGFPAGTYIVSVTAATSFVTNVATTASATVSAVIAQAPSTIGPGWVSSTQFGLEQPVPIVIEGITPVNINGASTTAIRSFIGSAGSASPAGAVIASPTVGQAVAISLQAYASRNTALTTAGITGHDWVYGIVGIGVS